MNAIRSLLVFGWLVLTVIPFGFALVAGSLFLNSTRLWWWFAAPFLRGVIGAARIIGGVEYRLHGEENLPGPDDMRRVILCPKHQSTWETFYFASMTSHPLAYVFKKELLRIPFFGWSIGRLEMIHIDRSIHRNSGQGPGRRVAGRIAKLAAHGTRLADIYSGAARGQSGL